MITYTEKGKWLHETVRAQGYMLRQEDGTWKAYDISGSQSAAIDAAVQSIIDNYDPLPIAQQEAIDRVNQAVSSAREKFATYLPFQSESYMQKYQDCDRFRAAGYPEADIANYRYVNARATRRNTTGKLAIQDVLTLGDKWLQLLFEIEDLRDNYNDQIKAETDWTQCKAIADAAEAEVETIS